MSYKTDFLKNTNISLLWEILSDENMMLKNGSKIFVENIFKVFIFNCHRNFIKYQSLNINL
jgi:hypothetical protein